MTVASIRCGADLRTTAARMARFENSSEWSSELVASAAAGAGSPASMALVGTNRLADSALSPSKRVLLTRYQGSGVALP